MSSFIWAKTVNKHSKTLPHSYFTTPESHTSVEQASCDSPGLWLTLFHCSPNHSRPLWLSWGETIPSVKTEMSHHTIKLSLTVVLNVLSSAMPS